MNKKGELIHWILLGLFVALGIFFFTNQQPEAHQEVKGDWALSFKDNLFLDAQRTQTIQEFKVSQTVYSTLHNFLSRGLVKTTSSCSPTNYYPFWNLEEFECFPDAALLISQEIQLALQEQFPKQKYQNIQLSRNMLTAQGITNTITQQEPFYATYSYDQSLALNLRYNLFETELIVQQARELLYRCRNVKDFNSCIESQQPIHFQAKECQLDAKTEPLYRVVPFCVTSPNGVGIFNQEGYLVPLRYKFRLDFTPTTPFVIEELSSKTSQNTIVLSFPKDDFATGYNLYFTDDPSVNRKTGSVQEIKSSIFNSIYQWEKRTLPTVQGCVVENSRTTGKAYACEDTIHYLIDKSTLPGEQKNLIFAITTTNNNQESEILTWALS